MIILNRVKKNQKKESIMAISPNIKKAMEGSSFIRKMFEEGIALKKKYGEENVYDFSLGVF